MRKNNETIIAYVIVLVIGLTVIFGVRALWAKAVYNDMRCTFAECRISK